MSPALIDTGAPVQNPFHRSPSPNKGQISSNLSISSSENSGFISNDQIASSFNMNPYGQSGFENPSGTNSNFEFNTPATTKLGAEKPLFSSNPSLTKPRMVKSRKSVNPRPLGSPGTRKNDPGFNPFRPVSDNLSGVQLENDDPGDYASLNRNKPFNLNVTSKVEKVGNALIDEIRKLRIESQADSHIASQSGNILNERGSASLSGIKQRSKSVEDSLPPELPDNLEKLNLGGSLGESSKSAVGAQENYGGNHGVNLGSSGGHNVGGSVGSTLASELPNDLKKLNLKDPGEIRSQNVVFGTASRSNFVFGSSRKNRNTVAPDMASTLPDKIKNLNIEDSEKGNGEEMNVNNISQTIDSGNRRSGTSSGGVMDPMILDDMERLKIGDLSVGSRDHADQDKSSILRKDPHGTTSKEESRKSNQTEFTSLIGEQGQQKPSGGQVHEDQSNKGYQLHRTSAPSTSPFPSLGLHFQPVKDEFQVPYMDGAEQKAGFGFSPNHDGLRVPHVEFKTPDPKANLFTGTKQKIEFGAKKGLAKDSLSRGRKGKLKESVSVLMSLGKSSAPKENSFQGYHEPSESSSPMDISPCQQTQDDEQSEREPSLASDIQTSFGSDAGFSNDATDEDLVTATECMDINKDSDVKPDEARGQIPQCSVGASAAMGGSLEDSVQVETESFKTVSENLDRNEENDSESNSEVQSSDQTEYFSASSSVSGGCSSFTFAASNSSQAHVSASIRHHRKKNRMKAGPEICSPTTTAGLSDAASSLQFSPVVRVPVLQPQVRQRNVESTVPQKGGLDLKAISTTSKTIGGINLKDAKREVTSPTAASRAAQEACEKWRLRGNQAYANGDLEKAESYYTQGLSCIPQNETSRDCHRALVLCYSNRAATRMSLGRMREALRDCLVAAEIDPNFFRVQHRAANCYLALGEVGDASRYFKKLLQSSDVCVERKLILEASEGMQKAQKVMECMDRSSLLLLQKTSTNAEGALGVIAEALVISPYSEQLLERKATALFMLRRYEEVIQLCQQTLEAAERNSDLFGAIEQSSNLEASELLKNYSFRIWRYSLIFKSNFYSGKLEEALDFLEKQEQWTSMVNKYGNETLESFVPQLSTARELIRHKTAGNEAFQAGRHTEAVECYTAALAFNVESRPFAAVCFGNRAAAYQALGQFTDAISDCSLAIALDGNYLKALSRRATLFEMIRDYDQAAKDLERLVSVLTKQAEEKTNQLGASLPVSSLADLRQARQRLYQMEEQAKKGVPPNFYLILGVEPSVTAADLKKAYRKAALKHHPDKAGQSLARSESGDDGLWKEIAEEVYKDTDRLFKMIGEAYAVLSDPTKRSNYDIEEETRNGQKKSGINRTHTDAPFSTAERGGSGSGRWRDIGRSSGNPYYRGFEPTRSTRYF